MGEPDLQRLDELVASGDAVVPRRPREPLDDDRTTEALAAQLPDAQTGWPQAMLAVLEQLVQRVAALEAQATPAVPVDGYLAALGDRVEATAAVVRVLQAQVETAASNAHAGQQAIAARLAVIDASLRELSIALGVTAPPRP